MNIKQQLETNNYVIVEDFIPPERAKDLYDNFIAFNSTYPHTFHSDDQCPTSPAMYDYRLFLELLVEKTPYMTERMGEYMLPTYSYARLYSHGDTLPKHTDREACEVSLSVHLGGDESWPIWFTKPDGKVVAIDLKPGQAVIYQGIVSEHWRDAYKGQTYGQVFLHYVKSRGNNWTHYFDKRKPNE